MDKPISLHRIPSTVKPQSWIGLSVGSLWKAARNLLARWWKSLGMETSICWEIGGWKATSCFRSPPLARSKLAGAEENCAYLCKQLITLSISTSLLYNGDKNLIIQRHANVAILVSTHSLLITMPLTPCNLLCELGHIKSIIPITPSCGSPEDRTKVIDI